MKTKPFPETETAKKDHHVMHKVEGVTGGAVAGAVLGAIGGPPGAIAGAVIGGAMGAIAAVALDKDADQTKERNRELDDEIGVSEGELGAPNLKHPAATVGAYSTGSAGGTDSDGESPAEGPMQPPED
jgi:hypothetical protein